MQRLSSELGHNGPASSSKLPGYIGDTTHWLFSSLRLCNFNIEFIRQIHLSPKFWKLVFIYYRMYGVKRWNNLFGDTNSINITKVIVLKQIRRVHTWAPFNKSSNTALCAEAWSIIIIAAFTSTNGPQNGGMRLKSASAEGVLESAARKRAQSHRWSIMCRGDRRRAGVRKSHSFQVLNIRCRDLT